MLVLTRKQGEKVRIGTDIEIEVLSVRGSRVRLGISCPIEIAVNRGELMQEEPYDHEQWVCNSTREYLCAGI